MGDQIDDILVEAGMSEEKQEQPQDENAKQFTELSKQMATMKAQQDQTATQLAQASKDREVLISRQARMAGYIEATGVGKYDPTTGEIIKIEPQVDEAKEIEQEIKVLEKELKSQLDRGDIEPNDYWRQLQEQRAPLKEKLDELKFDRRIKSIEKAKQDAPVTVVEKYNKVGQDYPDVNNQESELFKEMSRLFSKYPDRYGKASYDSGNGNADQFRALAESAAEILEAKGVSTSRQPRTPGQFDSPNNEGYQPKQAKSNITKSDVGMLVNAGYSNPALLKDVNSVMADYDKNGGVTVIKEY
jgi:hypothetical protein